MPKKVQTSFMKISFGIDLNLLKLEMFGLESTGIGISDMPGIIIIFQDFSV